MTGRFLRQPGPALAPRVVAVPCGVRPGRVAFPGGARVLPAVASALAEAGIDAAILEFDAGDLEPLVYVVPATSPDADHVAWYSEPRRPAGRARIARAVMSYGQDQGAPFLHCHGIWLHADGFRGGGHLVPDASVFAGPVAARVWAISGARLDRRFDAETNFSLFTPVAGGEVDGSAARGVLLRIKPNADIHAAIETAAADRGIRHGRIHGVCSLVDCDFADGRHMDSFASEAFIREGRLDEGVATLSIGVAALGGAVFDGEIRRGNVICIASEILVVEQ